MLIASTVVPYFAATYWLPQKGNAESFGYWLIDPTLKAFLGFGSTVLGVVELSRAWTLLSLKGWFASHL